MKRIKDFLYNWNDIVVILLILAGAAALIYWRVNVIMDYPKVLANEIQEAALREAEEAEAQDAEAIDNTETKEEDETGPGSGPEDNELWSKGRLLSEVSVETGTGEAKDAMAPLIEAGLFTSYEDYVAICEKAEVNPLDIKAGKFTFTAGSTQRDIVKEVTKELPAEAKPEEAQEATEEEQTEDTSEGEDTEEVVEESSEEEYVEEDIAEDEGTEDTDEG